jgi:predicted phage terminase large subunit-like protein
MRVYGASDYAVTSDGGDYTVHGVLGVDYDGQIYLLDMWRKQAASDEWVESWCNLVKAWHPLEWAEEQGQIRSGVGPFLVREARQRGAHVARSQFPTRGDKAVRAQSFRGLIATRGLRYLGNAPWRSDLEAELLRFPAGIHDDVVDMLGLFGQLLERVNAKERPKVEFKPATGYRTIGRRPQAGSIKVV